jgi:hypothetical protein
MVVTRGEIACLDPNLTQSERDKLCVSEEKRLSLPLDGRRRLYDDLHTQGSHSIAHHGEPGEGPVAQLAED